MIAISIDDKSCLCHFQAIEKFEKLAKLHVNNITINSWEEVSKLRWFSALKDVRMIHWDLFGVCHLNLFYICLDSKNTVFDGQGSEILCMIRTLHPVLKLTSTTGYERE